MAQIEVTMPKMGESITEGTVIAWHKQPGETIELDETLLEIGTDKVDTEVPSPSAGTVVKLLVEEGATVDVGTVIALIDTDGTGDAAKTEPVAAEEMKETEASDVPTPSSAPTTRVDPVAEPVAAAAPAAGRIEILMPKMGESIMEGTVLSWHKKPGDAIELDETLLEIATDKVDTEVPSPAAGTLAEILVEEGATVDVGTLIAIIQTGAGAPAATPVAPVAATPRATSSQPPSPVAPVPAGPTAAGPIPRSGSDGRFYSPLVRSIAEKEGVSLFELSGIPGSGAAGRVSKKDLLTYLERRAAVLAASPVGVPAAVPAKTNPTAGAAPVATPASPGGRVEIVEMDRMRQIIAEHMVRSKATSAHVTSFAEIDVTNLVRLREARKADFLAREGVKLTYTPFFVFAAVEAIKDHPIMNASVDGTRILINKDFHVGIAVAVGSDKLMVPVIRFAGQKNIAGLAHAAAELALRARTKKLVPDDLNGGTFTVTNVGSLGSIMGTPIINQPQVAILATGAIKKRPMVLEDPVHGDVIGIRHMMFVSLSYDHRVIDGAMAASYLQRYTQVLESFGADFEL